MSKKADEWTILGRVVGTATGWDQVDTFVILLHDFKPFRFIKLPKGTIMIDFEHGTATTHDDEGNEIESVDLIGSLPLTR